MRAYLLCTTAAVTPWKPPQDPIGEVFMAAMRLAWVANLEACAAEWDTDPSGRIWRIWRMSPEAYEALPTLIGLLRKE